MRALKTYTSLWAMQPHDQTGVKLPYDQVCEMVAAAGYDGMAIDLGAGDVAQAYEVQPLMEKVGLTPLIVAFPKTVESLRETLIMAKDFGSPFVDVIGQVMPLSVDGMIPVIRSWIEMSDEIGMPIQFEAHRNCITNDLYSTLCLLDAVPEMRMCADLSHYVVDREFWHPLSERDMGLISRVLAARSCQVRFFLSQSAQKTPSPNKKNENRPTRNRNTQMGHAMGFSSILMSLIFHARIPTVIPP